MVLKLFSIFEPDRAYFGEKDAQQLAVIRALVRDLNLRVEVIGCPIVREPDGLALSSRNTYLDPEERREATGLYRALREAEGLFRRGERKADALRAAMRGTLKGPRVRIDYLSVADPETFEELQEISGPARVLIAAFVGRTRLIDNLRLA